MVSGVTVRENVILDILAKLNAIDGPPNNRKTLTVYRMGGNVMQVPETPCAILIDSGADEVDSAVNNVIQVNHRFDIVVGVTAHDKTWADEVQAVCADVAAALRDDWTRGGYAHTTRVELEEVWDSSPDGEQPLVGGQVSLSVVYRHLYNDPTYAV